MKSKKTRRNAFSIMMKLILLLDTLGYAILVAIINGVLGFLSAMGVTVFGAFGISKFLGENINMSYTLIIILIITCGILRGVLRYFEQYFNHYIAFKLLALLRDKIFKSLRRLCPAKLECKEKGSIISMITSDIETLEVFYAHTISPICIAVIVSIIVIIFEASYVHYSFAILTSIFYILIGVIFPVITSKKLKDNGVNYRNSFSMFNGYFLDSIKGIKEIIQHNSSEKRIEVINDYSNELLKETKNIRRKTVDASSRTDILVSIAILSSVILGIYLVNLDIISIGKMIMGVVVIFNSFGPVIAISALPGNLTQTFASGSRILDLLEELPVTENVTDGKNIEFECLTVKNLRFGYGDKLVLNDINLPVQKGKIVGIVGESGCGKSTFLKLLLRFWKKTSGEILYNNIDIENINTNNLLDNVTMVSQTTYLFDTSIEENLKIAKLNATHEEIVEACKKASIHDFINSLPEGYLTKVGMLGERLSAGEKQRIGLARAFLSPAKLILLDEPTSNVDSINEKIILDSLKRSKSDYGIILVSHRESTMSICDEVYKIEDGKLFI